MFLGKLVGILLGGALLKFPGALLGYFIGHWCDQRIKHHLYRIPRSRAVIIQQIFFKSAFSVMGYLAKADGRINEAEIKAAEKMMGRLNLNAALRREAIELFSDGKHTDFNLEAALFPLRKECVRYPDLLRFFVEMQLEVALADAGLNTQEKEVLLLICEKLNFSPEEFEQLRSRYSASQAFHEWFSGQFDQKSRTHYHAQGNRAYKPLASSHSLRNAYGVLGVSLTAANAEIKKAYRRLMNQHHPDKLTARGLPDGMVKLAKEKTQEIRAAYDLIREERGFR